MALKPIGETPQPGHSLAHATTPGVSSSISCAASEVRHGVRQGWVSHPQECFGGGASQRDEPALASQPPPRYTENGLRLVRMFPVAPRGHAQGHLALRATSPSSICSVARTRRERSPHYMSFDHGHRGPSAQLCPHLCPPHRSPLSQPPSQPHSTFSKSAPTSRFRERAMTSEPWGPLPG